MATDQIPPRPAHFYHAEIVKRGEGRLLSLKGVGIEHGSRLRYWYTNNNRIEGPITIQIYDIASRNPRMPVLGYEVVNGVPNTKTYKLGLDFVRKAAVGKTYDQAFREYKDAFAEWREKHQQAARLAAAAASSGAAPDAAPQPVIISNATESALGASDPAVAARKRAREELIDSMTRDWTVDEVEALLTRKRRTVQLASLA
jgi:hypothetical protein